MRHPIRARFLLATAAMALATWRPSPSRADVDESAPLALDAPERKKAPPPAAEPAFSLPPIHSTVLDNGVHLLVVERHELPIIAMKVLVMRGVADAPPAVASLAAGAFFSGTTARSAAEISASLRRLGAIVDPGFSYDAIWVGGELLSSRLGDVLSIVAEMFQHPLVPYESFELGRTRTLGQLAATASDPSVLIQSAIDAALYAPSHPYREPLSGDENAIRTVTRDQVASFYRTHVQPDTTVVVLAGDIGGFAAERVVEHAFGQWKGQAAPRRPIPDAGVSRSSPRVVLVDRLGATQATIKVAEVGVSRTCPDRHALLVLNAILGSRSGRLSTELREARGATYGAWTSFSMGRGPRPFVLSSSVPPEKVGESTSLMLEEVRRITSEPVTSDELAFGRAMVLGALPLRFTSLRGTVDALSDLAMADRPVDDYANLSKKLAAMTPDMLLRVAKQYLRPDELRVFVVARAPKVKPQLESLGLGRVHVLAAGQGGESIPEIAVDRP